jgi:hypothetical protein
MNDGKDSGPMTGISAFEMDYFCRRCNVPIAAQTAMRYMACGATCADAAEWLSVTGHEVTPTQVHRMVGQACQRLQRERLLGLITVLSETFGLSPGVVLAMLRKNR